MPSGTGLCKCAQAFADAKQALASSHVLVHYDPSLPITLTGDASAYSVGAVISHTLPDGSERPIAFASRSLSTSEQNYAQLEKEACIILNIWSQEISPVPLWENVYTSD